MMSAASRKRIAAAQRARWAKWKAATKDISRRSCADAIGSRQRALPSGPFRPR
jgi:hypothetical protein